MVGFPSDDFNQELDKDADVASFCQSNFGVSFPMASRVHVRGSEAHPFLPVRLAEGQRHHAEVEFLQICDLGRRQDRHRLQPA